jgi:hypothetical protein
MALECNEWFLSAAPGRSHGSMAYSRMFGAALFPWFCFREVEWRDGFSGADPCNGRVA